MHPQGGSQGVSYVPYAQQSSQSMASFKESGNHQVYLFLNISSHFVLILQQSAIISTVNISVSTPTQTLTYIPYLSVSMHGYVYTWFSDV